MTLHAPPHADRKADHLALAAGDGVTHVRGTGLDAIRLRHRALPGRDLAGVDLSSRLLGIELEAPLMVSAMTGGTPAAAAINERLAQGAVEHGLAMTLGSGRALLSDAELLPTFRTRARPPLLLANLGAAGLEPTDAVALVDRLGADGLAVHLNAVQEAVQPEGQPAFGDVLDRIAATVGALAPLPVVVKEVGFGMDGEDVVALAGASVAAVDVAGAGGTNWARVEGRRDGDAGAVAEAFADWGVSTVEALRSARVAAPWLPVIASGGIRDGVEAAKCLALGAVTAGVARPLLLAAREDRVGAALATLVRQLRIATWACGAAAARELAAEHLR